MDEGPFEVSVDMVDGWLTVIRLIGDGCLVSSSEVAPMRRAIDDGNNRWFLIEASELTHGCDHLAGLIAQTNWRSRQRAGWMEMVCTGMVRRLVEVSSGGAVPVCDTVEQARDLLERRREAVEAELGALLLACQELPSSSFREEEGDYTSLLMMAALDLQMVRNRLEFHRWTQIDLDGLRLALAEHADDAEGNVALARSLWNGDYGSRAETLRRLVCYMDTLGVSDCRTLRQAMEDRLFPANIAEAVPGLTDTAHDLMRLRLGLPASRPTRQLRKFFEGILRRRPQDAEIMIMLDVLAQRSAMPLAELHWRIWQYRQGPR